MRNDIRIRFATEEDSTLILSFIRELAEYEKLLDQVVATEHDIRQTLFGDQKYAEVIIASLNQQDVGYALFFHNYSTFSAKPGLYLEDLYVKPAFRGLGVAKILLTYLANLAVERNCSRFEWACLDWNTHAIDFYLDMGSRAMNEWTTYRLNGNNLKTLANSYKGLQNAK